MGSTQDFNLVGVSFYDNHSLSERYNTYLASSPLTCPSSLLYSSPSCVVVATKKCDNNSDPLIVLKNLAVRNGFSRCSGRMFVMRKLSRGLTAFFTDLVCEIPEGSTIRAHAHPKEFNQLILNHMEEEDAFKGKRICSSPTNFSHIISAVLMDNEVVGWGIFTQQEYRQIICRPGDGDRSPVFELNFNRAELKIAEAVQHLTESEEKNTFGEELLAVDVGAAPGGWTGFLANMANNVAVIAVDPAELSEKVMEKDNVEHLKVKAEVASENGGKLLDLAGMKLVGNKWRKKLRLLVCDANMDIRDTIRELVLPLTEFLAPGAVIIVTVKLGRRVGAEGIRVKIDSATKMLIEGGFLLDSIRVHWLFGNSKNERTMFAVKM